eukprot:3706517-Amphidinium_carterae.1
MVTTCGGQKCVSIPPVKLRIRWRQAPRLLPHMQANQRVRQLQERHSQDLSPEQTMRDAHERQQSNDKVKRHNQSCFKHTLPSRHKRERPNTHFE